MRINLTREMFSEREHELVSYGNMGAFTFRYKSGVEALKIVNERGYIIILPFKGQQIWKIHFDGRDLSMNTTVKEPVMTSEFLKNYGGFLYHCGINSFGAPDAKNPQHGEIPNAEYNTAYLVCGEENGEKYISLSGTYEYDVAFTKKYSFSPDCRVSEKSALLRIGVTLENKRNDPMEYMYLCHINFLPIDGSELIYSAPYDKNHVTIHKIISPSLSKEKAEALGEYMDSVENNVELHHSVGAIGEVYDPEICFTVKYLSDENARAHTLQYKVGEGACYISHPTDALPYGIRWISRTATESAMGMVLPATGEHFGYEDSKKKGYVRILPANAKLSFYMEAGYLNEQEALPIIDKIKKIRK